MRRRIDPDSVMLGTFERPGSRRGRPVTQEEVAEAIGTSRVWYAMLESDASVRSSAQLLGRIADVLMLDLHERANLFSSAIPEIRSTKIVGETEAFIDNCAAIRSAARDLWVATSEREALTQAAKHLASWFEDVRSIRSDRRVEAGIWELEPVVQPRRGASFSIALADLKRSLKPEDVDALLLFPELAEPGVVGTMASHYSLSMYRSLDDAIKRNGVVPIRSFIVARIRSRKGLIASIVATHEDLHTYTESDRAMISTLAEVTSLALS